MPMLPRMTSFLRNIFAPRRADANLDDELRSYLDLLAEEKSRAGLAPEEARRVARLELGGVEQVKEQVREVRAGAWLDSLLQDLRYGIRTLRKNPGFTVIAVLTLALGIGANTAIFSFIDAVLLRSLPVQDPQHLVLFSWTARAKPKIHSTSGFGDCDEPKTECSLSVPFFAAVHAQANSFSGIAGFAGPLDIDFSGNGPARISRGQFVSGDFFSTLGVKTLLGRPLGPSDDSPSASPAIVLSYDFWQREFGSDPSAVGRAVRLNNVSVVIVGVADPHFTSITPGKTQDFFMPFSLSDRVRSEWWGSSVRLSDAGMWWVVIVARLKPQVPIGQAQAEATAIFRNELLHGAKPLSKEADAPEIKLLPARAGLSGESSQIAPGLFLTMAAVCLVLLIACANVAGLTLARSATRQREMAVRLALGAGRSRITRQLLTESVMLSCLGGALGILIAVWGVGALSNVIASGLDEPFPFVVALDWRILAFTIGVTFATGILFGLAPALRGARVDLTPSLKKSSGTSTRITHQAGRRLSLGNALVVLQVALSIVVLVGAGLLVRSLRNLHHLNPGFDAQNILLFGINPTIAGYKDQQTDELYRNLQQRFAALPGVISASYSEAALLAGDLSGTTVHLDTSPPKSNTDSDLLPVGLDFFSTMRIPLLAGRNFTPADFASAAATSAARQIAEGAEPAASVSASGTASASPSASPAAVPPASVAPVPVIINEIFARKFFPNEEPVGKHMGDAQREEPAKGPQPGYLIVGVVGNTKYNSVRHDMAHIMYVPLVSNSAHFELRTAADPTALMKSVRDVVSRADNNLPLFQVRTQTAQIEHMLFEMRLMSRLSSLFGILALLLACLGLYGLLSYEVTRRTREIGIRIALGAQRDRVLQLVVGQGILLALLGAALGIAGACGVTRYLADVLYNVHPVDPLTFAAVAVLLFVVALAASCIPAWRAARVDPMEALRYE